MNRRNLLLSTAAAAFALVPVATLADPTPAPATAAETAFVAKVTGDLTTRFATADAARKAGFIRYTDEDDSGAINYANREWTSADAAHPSQLWYDAKGRLIGADFSVPLTTTPPQLWGIDPSRWQQFHAHAHYGLVGPDGSTIYGGIGAPKLEAAGSSVAHPTAEALVAAGRAKAASDVRFVFAFPAIWDLSVWVIPNPSGPFAEKNPNVVPVKPKPM